MINIPSILATNGTGIVLLATLLFITRKKYRYSQAGDRIFFIMVIIDMAQCVIEPLTFLLIGKMFPGSREMTAVLNSMLFINNTVFAFLWTVYVDLKLFSDANRTKRISRYTVIPALIAIAGAVANIFTPVYFRITDANIYERGKILFLIPYIINYAYIILGTAEIYKYRNKVVKYMFMPAVIFMIPVVLGTVLQFLFYGMSLLPLSVALALNALYINVQNEISSIDALSGLYTRQYMNWYLDSAIRYSNSHKMIAGIMLDIDKFKSINDKYGHLIGDEAIMDAGIILHESVYSNGLAARFAGDEFIIILQVDDKDEITETIDRITHNTTVINARRESGFDLSFSLGYGIFDRGTDTTDTFFARIDKAMYKDKERKSVKTTVAPGEPLAADGVLH